MREGQSDVGFLLGKRTGILIQREKSASHQTMSMMTCEMMCDETLTSSGVSVFVVLSVVEADHRRELAVSSRFRFPAHRPLMSG